MIIPLSAPQAPPPSPAIYQKPTIIPLPSLSSTRILMEIAALVGPWPPLMPSASNMALRLEPPKINQRSTYQANSWLIALALLPTAALVAEEVVSLLLGYISKTLVRLPIPSIHILVLVQPATQLQSLRIPSRLAVAWQWLPTANQP